VLLDRHGSVFWSALHRPSAHSAWTRCSFDPKPFLKGHKNDYRDAEAIAEAVQRPTMHFVAIKTPEQMDLLALHRMRSRLVGQRTGVINQIRGFLIERGITVRQGVVPLRKALPDILSSNTHALSPR
jgi:transposase